MKATELQILLELAGQNLGAIEALKNMYHCNPRQAKKLSEKMVEIGMTGSKIWVGYKYCRMHIYKFMRRIEYCDKKMISYINKIVQQGGCGNSSEIQIDA